MMLGLIDRLIHSFSVARLTTVSLIARLITLFFLPSTPSFLAPDEGNYATLALWVAESRDVEEYPAFGPGLYNTGKTLILPAAALVKFGLDELTAVRIVSILFGTLSIYLFAMIIFLILGIRQLQDLKELNSQRIAFSGMCTFAFLPSSFIWSSLGLRESASEAMSLASVFLLLRLRGSKTFRGNLEQVKMILPICILGIFAISLSFGARRETAMVFTAFFCLFLLLNSKRKHAFIMAGTVICGTLIGLTLSTTPTIQAKTKIVWTTVERAVPVAGEIKSPAEVSSDPASGEPCDQLGAIVKTKSGHLVCERIVILKNTIKFSDVYTQVPIKSLDELETQREANRVGAQTQLSETKCLTFKNISLQNFGCNLAELPYRLFNVLFRPLPIIDSGSFSNNLASAENLIWVFLFLIFTYSFIISIGNRVKLYITIPTTTFVIAFVTLLALYEGNLGTAFRHKSTILWSLILVAIVVFTSDKTDSEKAAQENQPRHSGNKLNNE